MPPPHPIRLILHFPTTDAGQRALAESVACIHADWVKRRLKDTECPARQKILLLNALLAAQKEKNDDRKNDLI